MITLLVKAQRFASWQIWLWATFPPTNVSPYNFLVYFTYVLAKIHIYPTALSP